MCCSTKLWCTLIKIWEKNVIRILHTCSAQQAHQRNAQKFTLSLQVLLRSITVLFCFVCFFLCWFFSIFFLFTTQAYYKYQFALTFIIFFFYNLVNIMRDRDQFDNWCFLPSSRLKYKLTNYLWKNVWFNATENTHTQKQDFFLSLSFSGR